MTKRSDGKLLLAHKGVTRVPWMPDNVLIDRQTDPHLRHVVVSNVATAEAEEVAKLMRGMGLPLDTSIRACQEALKASGGKGRRQEVVAEAVRLRRSQAVEARGTKWGTGRLNGSDERRGTRAVGHRWAGQCLVMFPGTVGNTIGLVAPFPPDVVGERGAGTGARDSGDRLPSAASLVTVLARVLTFYSETGKIPDLVESLRSELPAAYTSLPSFRGALVLEKTGGNHIIALTLWEDEEGIRASEPTADAFADRIAEEIGHSVTRNVYSVVGSIGLEPPNQAR